MNASGSPARGAMRRSHRIALVLLGTTGVIGVATAVDAWRRARASDAAPPVSAEQVYANNAYIPGVGYYHAPYHAWFPHPYNYHDPARGYFAGGLWQAVPWVLAMNQSQPSASGVAEALSAQRRQQEQQRMGFVSGGGGRPGVTAPRPASVPSSRPSIIRGGFGHSAHPAGG